MRLIKLAILSVIILFLVVTLISLFIPSKIRISRATNIPADDTVVYTNVKKLSNWSRWHPAFNGLPPPPPDWGLGDTLIKVLGTSISLKDVSSDAVSFSMAKDNGRPVWTGFNFIRHRQSDSTTLQWYMDFRLRWYPWEKFRSLFYENIYGAQMEQGLSNLKKLSRAGRS